MAKFTREHAHLVCELLTEQELEIIFSEGSRYLEQMGVSHSNNPDGFFYNIAEAHAVSKIINPTHTVPDDLYDQVIDEIKKREQNGEQKD